MTASRRIAVIGGGWAGLAAATRLAEAGCEVHLFEAARTLGGRARRIKVSSPLGDLTLDNGQHILLGAYTACFDLLHRCGIVPPAAMLRLPLQLRYLDGTQLTAPQLPAPLHTLAALLTAHGFGWHEKFSLARLLLRSQMRGWRCAPALTVAQWWHGQPSTVIAKIWQPLCISALNTPPEEASAQVFLNVLRDSLGSQRAASDMWLPRCDLSALLADHAAQHLKQLGAHIHLGQRISDVAALPHPTQLAWNGVVLAVAPQHLAALLPPDMQDTPAAQFSYAPITTVYLLYPNAPHQTLAQPFYALQDGADAPGQFVFEASHLLPTTAQVTHRLLAVVISAADACLGTPQPALVAQVAQQLFAAWQAAPLSATAWRPSRQTLWAQCIVEKQATVRSRPQLNRPTGDVIISEKTGIPLVLAGDYLASPALAQYPATLETAVRSGDAAAQQLLRYLYATFNKGLS